MKNEKLLLFGGAAVLALLLMKKNTGQNPLVQAQAAASNIIGDAQAAIANILPTNTAGGTINIGSTGTGAINNIEELINMGLLSSDGRTVEQNNALIPLPGPAGGITPIYPEQSTFTAGSPAPSVLSPGPVLNNAAPLEGNNVYHAAEQIILPHENAIPSYASAYIANNGSLPEGVDPYNGGPQQIMGPNGYMLTFVRGEGVYR